MSPKAEALGSAWLRLQGLRVKPQSTNISLREITADTVRAVTSLSVAENQKHFVASNAISLAQALFAPEAWYRAIYCSDELVGFVMLYDESFAVAPPEKPRVGVWRLMVDSKYQGKGIGRAALTQVIEYVRGKRIFTSLQLSYVPGPECPEHFYLGLGFRHTGRVDEGQIVLELNLAQSEAKPSVEARPNGKPPGPASR